jgi:translation initiation factor 3 subunit F
MFKEIGMSVLPFDAEPIEDFLASKKTPSNLLTPEKLGTELDGLKASLKKLGAMLADVSVYIDKVNKGEVAPDRRIGRLVGEAISRIPQHSGTEFEKLFSDNVQDMLMVAYLANLTKAQLALSERLQVMGMGNRRKGKGGGGGRRNDEGRGGRDGGGRDGGRDDGGRAGGRGH